MRIGSVMRSLGHISNFMKITVLCIVFVLLLVGCSKKESATASSHFDLARGDLASPAEIITNNSGAQILYCVPIELSSAKTAALHRFAQKHPGGQLEFMVGSKLITKVRMPAHVDASSTIGVSVACDSFAEAKGIVESLSGLSY